MAAKLAAWRHSLAAKRGGMAAKLAASLPLAAKPGGMAALAAWRQSGGKAKFVQCFH